MILRVLHRVYTRPLYVIVAVTTAALTLSVLLLLPHKDLLLTVLTSSTVSLGAKLSLVLSLYGTLATSFTLFTGTYTVLIALLLGVDVSLLWYYVARTRKLLRTDRTLTLTGVGGFVSGIFGIGCAACGTIILSGLAQLLGLGWLLLYLPLHGAEFGVLGVVLLLITTYTLVKRINDPLVCLID